MLAMFSVRSFEKSTDQLRTLLSSSRYVIGGVLILLLQRLITSQAADPDLFARVAMGRLTVSQGRVPLTDPFSFTEKLPQWIDHEWLSGVVFYLTANTFGDLGLILLKLLLATLTALCVIHVATTYDSHSPRRIVWISLCLLHAAPAWTSTVRCQAFSYLFVPLLYWAMVDYRTRAKSFLLCLSPLVSIAWVNMHGGYALGLIIMALFAAITAYERRSFLLPVFVLAAWCLAPVVTPYGFATFSSYLLSALTLHRETITEWRPLHTDTLSLMATLVICTPMLWGALLKKRDHNLLGIAMLAFSGYCAARHIRFLPFFMITCAAFGGPYIEACISYLQERWTTRAVRSARALALATMCALCAATISIVIALGSSSTYRLDYSFFPVRAIESLRTAQAKGRLLINFNFGSFALWRLYPNVLVSVDGRYEETYPEQTLKDNSLALRPDLPEGKSTLDRLQPTHILSSPLDGLARHVKMFGKEWNVVYQDAQATILAKDNTPLPDTAAPASMWEPQF